MDIQCSTTLHRTTKSWNRFMRSLPCANKIIQFKIRIKACHYKSSIQTMKETRQSFWLLLIRAPRVSNVWLKCSLIILISVFQKWSWSLTHKYAKVKAKTSLISSKTAGSFNLLKCRSSNSCLGKKIWTKWSFQVILQWFLKISCMKS